MAVRPLHNWNVTPADAIEIQNRLRREVLIEPLDAEAVQTVAGADISFDKGMDTVFAGFVVLKLPELTMVERRGVKTTSTFPYVPGLLSFREVPPLLEAWQNLAIKPDAILCDGQGLAHPCRFGIACHLGLLLDMPTVGCAKSILVGAHEPVGEEPGDWTPLKHHGEVIGAALRTRRGVSPIYVSIGHRCDLKSAIALVRRCAGPTRVPETTRHAHLFVNELRRASAQSNLSRQGLLEL
jgi:deoxyribonuclease V